MFLTSLDKVGEEKDEIRDSNSQLKQYINHLKSSMSILKETFSSYSHTAEIAEILSYEWLNYNAN